VLLEMKPRDCAKVAEMLGRRSIEESMNLGDVLASHFTKSLRQHRAQDLHRSRLSPAALES
jgi:hypothetical protein